jgi:hypothetical protein
MQRSKQQALMFLLGAVLVGGVLGFSADRVFAERQKHWAPRMRMYQDLGLSESQINAMDSLLDARNCQIRAVMGPVQPQLDSIKAAAHQQVRQILTSEQRAKLEARAGEERHRDSLQRARRDSLRAAGVLTTC